MTRHSFSLAFFSSSSTFRMRETLRILGLALAETPMQKAEVLFRDFGKHTVNEMCTYKQADDSAWSC